jgi:hypothetical protein
MLNQNPEQIFPGYDFNKHRHHYAILILARVQRTTTSNEQNLNTKEQLSLRFLDEKTATNLLVKDIVIGMI